MDKDEFGLEDSGDKEQFMQDQDGDQQVANFDDIDDDDDDDEEFEGFGNPPEANPAGDDDEDDDENGGGDQYDRQEFAFGADKNSESKNADLNTKKVENDQFDEALEIDDSNEIESGEDDEDEANDAVGKMTQANQAKAAAGVEEEDDGEELPGQYNAAEYANLNVSNEVKELFEYIGRYKPQKINLDTTFRPFIPEYIPCVGEVDAFLKMPKPDGAKEDLGITVLDEPALNHVDPSVLEMKYIQKKQTGKKVEISIRNIENAEKNPKDIQNWIKNVAELHEGRPPATVQYTKVMPDFDNLMEVWTPQVEQILQETPFPGPEIDLSTEDYAKTMLAMLDIPVHNLPEDKGIIEGLHMMFTLYSTFKENQHFQKQQQQEVNNERTDDDFLKLQ